MPSGDNYMDFHLDYPQSQGAMIIPIIDAHDVHWSTRRNGRMPKA